MFVSVEDTVTHHTLAGCHEHFIHPTKITMTITVTHIKQFVNFIIY